MEPTKVVGCEILSAKCIGVASADKPPTAQGGTPAATLYRCTFDNGSVVLSTCALVEGTEYDIKVTPSEKK